MMAVLLYLSASIVFLYGLRQQIRRAYLHSFWDGARYTVAAFWLATGKFLHGTLRPAAVRSPRRPALPSNIT